ncbi:MAG: ABC transporter permease [Ignisphaera sp.]|nr:ABC transporter permease [Ignisphaera sp.]MDW8084830.1 ABC transporter permease [Ignisphaera sp.]
MPFLRAAGKKILIYTLLFLIIVAFLHVSARLIPGDPITVIYGEIAEDAAARYALERRLGLDKPVYMQLLMYIGNILSGNWGKSIYTGESVISLISRGFISSLKLALLSTVLVLAICSLLLYAEFVHSLSSRALQVATSLLSSMPTAMWGAVLILLLTWFKQPVIVGSILPPLIVLTIVGAGLLYKVFRSALEYSYQQPFVETYVMMGYSRRYIFLRALGYSVPTILSAVMYRAGLIIAGAIVAETMFMYPGMGFIFYTALSSRDYPVLIGWGVAVSVTLICINLAVDLLHSVIDPRVAGSEQ